MSPSSPFSNPPPPPGGIIKGTDVVLAIVATVLLYLVGMALVGILVPPGAADAPGPSAQVATLAQLAVMSAALLGAVYLVVVRRSGQSWRDLGYVRCDPMWIRRAVLLAVVLLPIVMMFAAMVRDAIPAREGPDLATLIVPKDLSWFAALVTLVYAGLIAPIAEEVFFRGLLFGWLRRHLRFAIAAPLGAAAFAILHQRPDAIAAAFVIGLVLSWLYERSRSLVPAITLHQVVNTAQLGLLYLGALARPAAAV